MIYELAKKMFKEIIGKVRRKFQQRLVLLYLFDRLGGIGIQILPYYIVQEFLCDEADLSLDSELEPVVVDLLSSSEIKQICANPESEATEEGIKELLDQGCLCFVLKYNDEIVAYTWCDLRRFNYWVWPFSLREDEAYLFGAYTFKAYRGKNLAPLLRYQLYKHLSQMGRTKFYSVTKFFNTSAIKLKKKLNSKPLKLCLCIRLFSKYRWDITLKKYQR